MSYIYLNNGLPVVSNNSASGTDRMSTEADGTLVFQGASTVWDDLRVPLYARSTGSAPSYTSGFAGNATLYAWYFANGATDMLHFEMQMPHGWRGTVIYPHVHWAPVTTGTGTVRWMLEWTWAEIGATYGASSTYNMDETISTASQWKHLITGGVGGLIPSSSQDGLSSMLVGRIYRVGGGTGDTYAGSAALLAIDFHYELDTVGSREPTAK